MSRVKQNGFSTKAVRAGENRDPATGAVVTPIYETSVFAFTSTKQLVDAVSEKSSRDVYTRWSNPTITAAEKKIAELEGAEECVVFSSGMAAISTAIMSLVSSGDHIVSVRDLYGGTVGLFSDLMSRFGVRTTFVEATNVGEISSAVRSNTKILFLETPTNPTLKLVDLQRAAEIAAEHGAKVLVDNTFASPYNQQPLQFGCDATLHSATKYLAGHNDVTAGAIAGPGKLIEPMRKLRRTLGGVLDPHGAWLLLRGMKTLALRMARHNSNGQQIAEYLENHPNVEKVYYPGLRTHPQHTLAKRQMKGFGGVVSFELKGDLNQTMRFVDNLKLALLAPSLGGTETLVSQPSTASHFFMDPDERRKAGISDSLVRLSLGIEDAEDIISDLAQALDKA
ncbi:MAG: aminotransferase class I/II-fold pyridoxal phosphate-dependent enzyme [Candidatus Bathyarchaeia archaeon]|jgi:cystathionine beta-lyase/cystathionine gamma-synthase